VLAHPANSGAERIKHRRIGFMSAPVSELACSN
jgi:hypothetical protein